MYEGIGDDDVEDEDEDEDASSSFLSLLLSSYSPSVKSPLKLLLCGNVTVRRITLVNIRSGDPGGVGSGDDGWLFQLIVEELVIEEEEEEEEEEKDE